MAQFHNPQPHTLRFQLGDRRYEVPPGREVEIPDRLAYAVAAHRVPLAAGPAPDATAAAPVQGEPAVPPPRVVPAGVSSEKLPPAIAEAISDGVDEDEAREDLAGDPDEPEPTTEPGDDPTEPSPVAEAASRLHERGVTLPGVARAQRPRRGGR